jgi:anti-sigma regulatory factor (Ser/Thr protein kinase)
VRRAVAEWAAQAGLPGKRAADFLIAVNEIAANAIRHGSPLAWLDLQIATGTTAQAEVRDSGHWPPGPVGGPDLDGAGMGLRLVRRVCDDVVIRRGADGSTVIVRMGLPGPGAARPES